MIIGVVGAILGGYLAGALFGINVNEKFFDLATWVSAIVGAIILLLIYRAVAGRKTA
jgi:uncharacterized membrane protein YeaQ/YmgE (transglycosylase-associated protein family)